MLKMNRMPLIAACLLCMSLLPAAAGEPAAPPAKVPEWAVGVLALRQFGPFFDKVGAYANQIVPNSGELAKQKLAASLFKLPVNNGLKSAAPVLIYILDPLIIRDMSEASALVLPVADPEKVKTALVNALGLPTENAGVLTFTLPQPLPQPDKTLLVKIGPNRLFAAPNVAVLQNLEEFAGQKPLEELGGTSARDDALLTLKVERFKRLYGKKLEVSFELGAQMAALDPQQAEKLGAQMKAALNTLWQVDCLEAHLALSAQPVSAALEIKIRPVAGSVLAAACQKGAGSVDEYFDESLIYTAWNMNGQECAKWLQKQITAQLPQDSQPITSAAHMASQALSELLTVINGHVFMTLNSKDQGLVITTTAMISDPAKAEAGIKPFVEKLALAINEAAKTQTGAAANVLAVKALPVEQYDKTTIQQFRFEVPGLSAEEQLSIQRIIGWPPTLYYKVIKAEAGGFKLIAGFGKISLETFKDRRYYNAPQCIAPLDSFWLASVRPIYLAETVLTLMAPASSGITTGLPDAPVTLSARMTADAASLRITLPAETPQALVMLWQRMRRANFDLERLISGHPASVPAPAPVK